MATIHTAASPDSLPLPRLSDQAAVELYLFVEQLFLFIESRYADQIRRHFDDLDQYSLFDPDDSPVDDLKLRSSHTSTPPASPGGVVHCAAHAGHPHHRLPIARARSDPLRQRPA